MSNMVDRELTSRASLLHSNAAALAKQEKDVMKGTEALRKETAKLAKVAKDAERKVKEAGNVQNWAEVLERDFLVLQETLRLVREGSAEGSELSGSWTGSYSGSERSKSRSRSRSRSRGRRGSRRGSNASGIEEFLAKGKQNVEGGEAIEDAVEGEQNQREDQEDMAMGKEQLHRSTSNFSPVSHAVAESISEAMATSLTDAMGIDDDDDDDDTKMTEAKEAKEQVVVLATGTETQGAKADEGDAMEVDRPSLSSMNPELASEEHVQQSPMGAQTA
jgi:hypothetical protein